MSAHADRDRALARAEAIARTRHASCVTTSHLMLALLSDAHTRWPTIVAERGGLTHADAAKRLDAPRPRDEVSDPCRHLPSVRLASLVLVGQLVGLIRRLVRALRTPPAAPVRTAGVRQALADAEQLANVSRRPHGVPPDEQASGHLLLALCLMPGRHLRLLDNPTLPASAIRRELGLAGSFDRLLLRFDGGRVGLRRAGATLRARSRARLISLWTLAFFLYRAIGAFWHFGVFLITIVPTVALYVFLGPALLLVSGVRTLVGLVTGCDLHTTKWYDIPGGEAALRDAGATVSSRRLAATMLIPRAVAFACCIVTLAAIGWRSSRLGVIPLPHVFTRPDLLTGDDVSQFLLAPVWLTSDFVEQYGAMVGLGLVAGVGAGMLSLPTYREIEMLRLHAGHERGMGTAFGRVVTYPVLVLMRGVALVETVLPFRQGPLYVTVYVVPLVTALVLALLLSLLLPY
jgi:hypothetical protein